MAKIAFILLCHKDPKSIIDQANRLTAVGDYIAIHFDRSAKAEHYKAIRAALDGNPNVTFARKRVSCGWGEWSLVRASLNAVEAAVAAFPAATHFYMLSGDCMAIKSAEYAHRFLDEHDSDFIESFDFFESDWIKTGMKEERLIYRHYFNERENKQIFYWSWWLQRRLGMERAVPADIQVMIGSQWWCLRRNTIEAILDFCRDRRDVMRFFATTWIPDETFFQTLVRHLVPEKEIETRTLTFLMFSDYGMPVTFYNDQYDLLMGQDFLFARKIRPEAKELYARLGELYAAL
ncbi:MAG: beta-1,6-N-acetylglucosaminyltransferase, partial [Pseudomonadota bacterium]